MDLGLQDKVVFISGASGGIGRALAQTFAAEGAFVALHGHRQWEALNEWLSLVMSLTYTNHGSNIPVFEYDRLVTQMGLLIRK